MAQLGLVVRKNQVEYVYAEYGTMIFSQSNGDFFDWIKTSGISLAKIDSFIVQKDFCEELPMLIAQVGVGRLQYEASVQARLFIGKEEEAAAALEELRRRQLAQFDAEDVVTPDVELIRNQITRENYWVMNLLLHEQAREFVENMIERMRRLGVRVPLYFMTGSGYLTDEKNVLRNPVLTWRSKEALELLSAARYHHLEDFIYSKKEHDGYALQVMKDGEPVVYQNHCSFNGYELPPWFVKITRSKPADLEQTIAYLKRMHGHLPLMKEGDERNKQLDYSMYAAKRNPIDGLFQIPYRKRLFRQITIAHVKETDQIEEEVKMAMDNYLLRNGINLKDPVYTISKENWQYSLERVVRLELRVVGGII